MRAIQVLAAVGIEQLESTAITHERVGCKALGLSAIPLEWSLPFVVITADVFELSCAVRRDQIDKFLATAGFSIDALAMVRSSGTAETLQERGRLRSAQSVVRNVAATIEELRGSLTSEDKGQVHWVVQALVNPRARGHLSNERRTSREQRDWLLEVEAHEGRLSHTNKIPVRRWRDGTDVSAHALSCSSEMRIGNSIKPVAMWATRFASRIHFEWVWDGKLIWIVQADIADATDGTDPAALQPLHIATVKCDALQVFREATPRDFSTYRKLKNAYLYTTLGYAMPSFYVLDQQDVIKRVLAGDVCPRLRADLEELTRRPLVLRADGLNIPDGEREMLPRSDELRSASKAIEWLLRTFAQRAADLADANLCLIGHHFIPSVACAWARAEPERTMVRIESLWGLPDGLCWFSHDTFEVDTRAVKLTPNVSVDKLSYSCSEHMRFKGTFIAPDRDGRWVNWKPSAPHDWTSSVRKKQWLFEIALRTRQIANKEGFPVSVMWFVDNHPEATQHSVLPWFHNRALDDEPKAAPARKWASSCDVRIKTAKDWERLRTEKTGARRIERIIVEPMDPSLVRNRDFAVQLASVAKAHGAVVELSGGVLSHAYYMLIRGGARVECVDLSGRRENVVKFNKVVRDNIAAIIAGHGERVVTTQLRGDALVQSLKQKLIEEACEALDATSLQQLIGELADVLEVIHGICQSLDTPFSDVESERKRKFRERGGFERGLMLIRTATSPSIPRAAASNASVTMATFGDETREDQVISDPRRLPENPVYRKLDTRKPQEQQLEKMMTVEVELARLRELTEVLDFELPADGYGADKYSMVLEMRRIGGDLRATVRIRRIARQLELDLPDCQLRLDLS